MGKIYHLSDYRKQKELSFGEKLDRIREQMEKIAKLNQQLKQISIDKTRGK